MNIQSRREFLRSLAQFTGAITAGGLFPESIRAALAIPPAVRTGTIMDVQHVVIFMQENRSFDHYFGSLRGVRGFNDRRTIMLPSGKPVWHQANVNGIGTTLPFHMDTKKTNAQYVCDLPHDWPDQHQAWNNGKYDQWIPAKKMVDTPLTMGFHRRDDMPYHYALVDAFTICDQYFCSVLGPTDPNRIFHWTGKIVAAGARKGAVTTNSGDDFTWTTYPERLEAAGVSWQMYQQSLTHDPETGNFEDNPLAFFEKYKQAQPGTSLHRRAMTPRTLDDFAQDVASNKLPQVSWMVAPELYSEHPSSPPGFGAYYTSRILEALTANPEVWSTTAFIINFDENDGFFDHVPPFTPPRSDKEGRATMDVSDEIIHNEPYGMGPRVPMIIVSPWTRGGYVCSQVFDHTSVIRFLEARFGVHEPNIGGWRRAVCGDLTSALNFSQPNVSPARLPKTTDYKATAIGQKHLVAPTAPLVQSLPAQERGVRPARSLPYEFQVEGKALEKQRFSISFASTSNVGGAFHVYSRNREDGPWKFAVDARSTISDTWDASLFGGKYDFEVFGANGFYRRFTGDLTAAPRPKDPDAEVALHYNPANGSVAVVITNSGRKPCTAIVSDEVYKNQPTRSLVVAPGQSVEDIRPLQASALWYDVTIQVQEMPGYLRHLAGHMENGLDSTSDPAMAESRDV